MAYEGWGKVSDESPLEAALRWAESVNDGSYFRSIDPLTMRLKAFATEAVQHGDMTPAAQIMLERILGGE